MYVSVYQLQKNYNYNYQYNQETVLKRLGPHMQAYNISDCPLAVTLLPVSHGPSLISLYLPWNFLLEKKKTPAFLRCS